MARRSIVLWGLAAGALLGWCPRALALNPALDVSQYAHTSWKIRDGFFQGTIRAIAQTPDGYLWLGTEAGLLRFDGVKMVPWQPPPDQHLVDNIIWSLLAARDGTLWIGTSKGLASWKDGKLTDYPELAGQYIYKLLEDREGTIWVAGVVVPTGRLCAIRNGSVQCYGDDGAFGRGLFNFYEDSKGNLWVGGVELWRWKPGPPRFYSLPDLPNGIRGLGEDTDGALLIAWRGGIYRFVDGETEFRPMPGAVGQFDAFRLLRDLDGGLWIGTADRGLLHEHKGKTDVFAPSDGLSGRDVYTLFEDREGSIWVSTRDGLDRFRDFPVSTFTVNQGLLTDLATSVLADRGGSVWLGTSGGLNRWNNGQIGICCTAGGKPDAKLNGLSPHSLFQDHRGRIWVSTIRGIGYLKNDHFTPVNGVPPGNTPSIVEDTAENLWIARDTLGLFQLSSDNVVRQIPWDVLGHRDYASALAADPLRGGLWLGFYLGGIAYWRDGAVRATYTAIDGLGEGHINYLRVDQDGTLWAATEGGLSRLKNGRIATLSSKRGLPCDTVHWAIEDDDHSLWLYTACGLVRIARGEMDAWSAAVDENKDPKATIHATIFDTSDGVRILGIGSRYSPPVARSSDGRLWFLPLDGVSVIDPRHLPFNSVPPPVHVEQITADHKSYDADSFVGVLMSRLPPLIRDLEIDYTALSLVAPEKVLFRYKLENWDKDWQDVGNRRQAFYNNLPPGNYRFRVMACNNSGVWNETGTFLDFSIAPAYYQTTWFRASCAAAFLLLVAALYQMRVRQVAQQVRARMEERLDERERIARDLHDTLLQSVQGLILKFHAATKQIPPDLAAHDALEKALDRADEVLAEGRDRVRNLRADTIPFGGLPAAFQRVAEETPQPRPATFKTLVEGRVRLLHPLIREETFSIGREALVNALTHSKCRHVEVEIMYDPRQFRVRVRDDGRGLDPKILEAEGRPGHWGLQGMRERSERIGGQLKIWSGPETGTEIELTIPGAAAYQADNSKSKRLWFRRSSGKDGDQL